MPAIHLPVPVSPSKITRFAAADAITLAARQESTTFVTIPSSYGDQDNSPSPGVIVGIVLGSVAGFLLLLYLVYCILHGGLVLIPMRSEKEGVESTVGTSTLGTSTLGTSTLGTSSYRTRSVMSFRSRKDRDRKRRSSAPSSRRSGSRAETVQVRTRSRRRTAAEPVIVDPPRSPSPVSTAPPRVVPASEVSALSEFDEIVVEEEHSSPRRHDGRRHSPGGPGYRRDSYYRGSGDADRYYPQRDSPGRRGSRRY